MLRRRHLAPVAAAMLYSLSGIAAAQDYPARPIRLVIPFPPGGSNDVVGRMVAIKLGEKLGKQMVVDNRGGAGGVVGTEGVALTAPDGAVLWNAGVRSRLEGLGGASDLNDRLEVVGWGDGPGLARAAVWREGVVTRVGPSVNVRESRAVAVNADGAVVGIYRLDDGGSTDRSFLSVEGRVLDPGGLGGTDLVVKDIDRTGLLVGIGMNRFEASHAFLWRRGSPIDLDPLPDNAFTTSGLEAVNDLGQAVGWAGQSTHLPGCLWKGGRFHPLPLPPGFDALSPLDIDNRARIVGRLQRGSDERACLVEGSTVYDLNTQLETGTSGWQLLGATGINTRGEIVGYGFHSGVFVAFLLRPSGLVASRSMPAE